MASDKTGPDKTGPDKTNKELAGRKIAFLTANEGVEQVELTRPWEAVKKAGGDPDKIDADLQAAVKKFGAGLNSAGM